MGDWVKELIEVYESKPELLTPEFTGKILSSVIQLAPDRIDFVSYLLKTPGISVLDALEQAYVRKNHRLIRLLTFYQMDLKMRQQIESYAKKYNESLGLINALDDFLQERFLKKSALNGWKSSPKDFENFMNVLQEMVIYCVEKTYPISQDILLLVWHYQENNCMSKGDDTGEQLAKTTLMAGLGSEEKQEFEESAMPKLKRAQSDLDLMKSSLWKCIEKKLSSILEKEVCDTIKGDVCNKMKQQVEWHWFEKNWLNSVLWLEKIYPNIVSAKSLHLERSLSPPRSILLGDEDEDNNNNNNNNIAEVPFELISSHPSLIDDEPALWTRNLDRFKMFQMGLFNEETKPLAAAVQSKQASQEKPKLLYNQLMTIGDTQLEKVRKALAKEMKVLIEKHPEDWRSIVQYRPPLLLKGSISNNLNY
ncbi:hypothetical protein RFI_17516, partial [Reticulomyxa filosa]